jgi:DNA (cytosine-5)-methyltransferase 1
MNRPLIVDAFCKAGGAGMGYHRAGFDVVGIDIEPQPRYPFEFIQGNVFDLLPQVVGWYRPVAIHGSPVCKVHSDLKAFAAEHHTNQIPQTREMFEATGLPYVIENVEGAPLLDPVWLCGSMFGLGVQRHRGFELGRWKAAQPACRHAEQAAASPMYLVKRYHSGHPVITPSPVIGVIGVYGRGQGLGPGEVDLWRKAMGIDWMVRDELSQAIPPAYTEYIGAQILDHLGVGQVAA